MSEKRPSFEAIRAPWTWEHALEYARKGRPQMLAWMVSEECIPERHRAAVAELLADPPAQPKMPKRAFLEHEAEGIRDRYRALTTGREPRRAPKQAHADLAEAFGVREGTIRDIVERKKSYASRGEEMKKTPQKKRVTTKRR